MGLGIVLVFVAVALIFSQLIPGNPSPTDYLVIGTAATMVCLITLFAILIKTWVKQPDVFYARRRRSTDPPQSTGRTSTSA